MAIETPARARHFCNPGDLIASMAGLKSFYEKTGRKVIVSQQKNVPSNYYEGAKHGTVSDSDANTMVCMNTRIFDMIKPLVESQEYIHSMEEFTGQTPVHINIDIIRKEKFVNLPHGQIQAWIFYAYPDLGCDLSKPWITLPPNPEIEAKIIPQVKEKIVLNFTERYRNNHVNYYFLRKFKHRLIFAGTEREHLLFVNKWGIDMPLLQINNFLELAYGVYYCKFFLGCQSMMWNLAEAMKTPRILEICEFAVNCMPWVGEKSYGFYHQDGLEHYVDILTC